jgi:hypothetical protein
MKVLEKNPYTYYVLKDENEIVGFVVIMPLKPGKLNSILAQTLPVEIAPEDIEVFEEGKNIDLYLSGIGVKPIFSNKEKHFYGSRLISGLIGAITGFAEKGISIGVIAGRSNMPDGTRLMRHAGFTEIEPLTPERKTFIINAKESGNPFIMRYKEKLHRWQEEHKKANSPKN